MLISIYNSLGNDSTYLDGNRWMQLILYHTRHLKIIDTMISFAADFNQDIYEYTYLIHRFQPPFWHKRGWFFEYQVY
jgi:hypothetical protein